jgi:hypothetical protein
VTIRHLDERRLEAGRRLLKTLPSEEQWPALRLSARGTLLRTPAVYIILGKRGTVLYVGQTNNIGLRLRQQVWHLKLGGKPSFTVLWYPIGDSRLRLAAERLLIRKLAPKLNRQAKRVGMKTSCLVSKKLPKRG